MTEKRQTLQGYIIRILQHFATKLWNITNFVMLFQAVMKFLSRLVEFKILVNWGMVHLPMQNSYCDHRNFDSVNQSYDSCLITEHSYGGTVEGSVSTHVPIQIVLIKSQKVAL
jgi:hypothetical protein